MSDVNFFLCKPWKGSVLLMLYLSAPQVKVILSDPLSLQMRNSSVQRAEDSGLKAESKTWVWTGGHALMETLGRGGHWGTFSCAWRQKSPCGLSPWSRAVSGNAGPWILCHLQDIATDLALGSNSGIALTVAGVLQDPFPLWLPELPVQLGWGLGQDRGA